MKILALYPFLPFPATSGGKMRGCSILEALASRHSIQLVSFLKSGDRPERLPTWHIYSAFLRPPIMVDPEDDEVLSPKAAAIQYTSKGFPNLVTQFDRPPMWNRLSELDLNEFDVVHIRLGALMAYGPALKKAAPHLRLVIDLDDIPSVFLRRNLRQYATPARLRQVPWHARELLRAYRVENSVLPSFDSVWVCSEVDRHRLSHRIGAGRALAVPNTVDTERLGAIERNVQRPALLFVGSFSYGPNRKGADFLLKRVWPRVRKLVPEAELWLVGGGADENMRNWHGSNGVVVTGAVEEVEPYLESAALSVAPVFTASGTRLKILEAFAAGLPVLTSTIGAEGIEATPGQHLVIADTEEQWVNECVRLLNDSALRQRLATAAKVIVYEKYSFRVMADIVLRCYESLELSNRHTCNSAETESAKWADV